MQTVPDGRQPIRGGVRTKDDRGGADVSGEIKGAGRVWGLREGDGGRVAGIPSDDTAWEGEGGQVGLERISHGKRRNTNLLDRVPDKGRDEGMPSGGLPRKGWDTDDDEGAFLLPACPGNCDHLVGGNLPHSRCSRCDILVPWRTLNGRHQGTAMCRSGAERKRR